MKIILERKLILRVTKKKAIVLHRVESIIIFQLASNNKEVIDIDCAVAGFASQHDHCNQGGGFVDIVTANFKISFDTFKNKS